MKNRYIFLMAFIVIISSFFLFTNKTDKENTTGSSKENIKPYYNIRYVGDEGTACLTFYNENEYSLFDCDSEPTEYFFDSEDECTYKISGDEMIFDCKYNIMNSKTHKIKITKWTKDEFSFIYNGKEKTFIKEN